ncbi:MAG: flagellar biosynthesis protein FliQ [Myxococcota bacterium]|jgi:flagellar biosynthetic protein FliQ|nr:flagellar biosynthesis protein FliQ [Myxococcota bacterium]MEC9439553.1 flagellar biosynthesis protein FliQ [Myxococcota bacterium]
MQDFILQIAREGLLLALIVSAPPVLTSLFVGLLVSIVQATTQIQEQTLTFVPKLVAVFVSLAISAPWIGAQLVRFTHLVFSGIH